MSTAINADALEIHIPGSGAATCLIYRGPARQAFRSTPRAVALALLADFQDAPDTTPGGTDYDWTDLLSTHGVATGRRGRDTATLAILPPTRRTVRWTADGRTRDLTLTYPTLLAGLSMIGGRFHRGVLFCLDRTHQADFTVTNAVPGLTPFPYGNVYAGSGHICWGSVQHSHLRTLPEFLDLFFTSGFNHDLWHGDHLPGRQASLGLLAEASGPSGVIAPPTLALSAMNIPGAITSLLAPAR